MTEKAKLSRILGLILVIFLLPVLSGCSSKPRDDDDDYDLPVKRSSRGKSSSAAATLTPIKATEKGTIVGKVLWQGERPSQDELAANLKKSITGNPDKDYCLTGKLAGDPADMKVELLPCETDQQSYRIGQNGGLGNVFVWIEPEAGKFFELSPDLLESVPKKVMLTQPHCAFLPHCMILMPSYRDGTGKLVPSGQEFLVENDARVGHNAKVKGGPLNGEQGSTIPARNKDGSTTKLTISLRPDKVPVSVSCDIHGWMKAWIRVFDHPFAAVSSVGSDLKNRKWEDEKSPAFGTFEIRGVPVGARVRLFAWHEELGFLGDPK
ncbi:MAG: hypothetical protein ACKO23_21430, partial [Gemmataceae bacterium]